LAALGDDRGKLKLFNLDHDHGHTTIAALGVTFPSLEVHALTRMYLDSTPISTRDPA
jgi:hypothetical protein